MGISELRLAVFALPILAAAPAQASIPPWIAVRVVSTDRHAEVTTLGLVEMISAYDNFQKAQSELGREVRDCLGKPGAEACARSEVRKVPVKPSEPPALVIVERVKGDTYRLTCVGAGEKASKPEAQHIVVDMKKAFFGAREVRFPLQYEALGCIRSAADEARANIGAD